MHSLLLLIFARVRFSKLPNELLGQELQRATLLAPLFFDWKGFGSQTSIQSASSYFWFRWSVCSSELRAVGRNQATPCRNSWFKCGKSLPDPSVYQGVGQYPFWVAKIKWGGRIAYLRLKHTFELIVAASHLPATAGRVRFEASASVAVRITTTEATASPIKTRFVSVLVTTSIIVKLSFLHSCLNLPNLE